MQTEWLSWQPGLQAPRSSGEQIARTEFVPKAPCPSLGRLSLLNGGEDAGTFIEVVTRIQRTPDHRRLRHPCETRCEEAGGGRGKGLQGKELINPKAASLDHFGSEMTVLIQEDLLIFLWSPREGRDAKNMLNSSELKKALFF